MKGALQLARVAGIPVRVHWTFGLLLLWVVYASFSAGLGTAQIILSVSVVAIVFLCVILHEYGHALMARRFGVNTRDIILSPIGGIARLEYIPDKPVQEILIAIAGPAVNFVIAGLLLLFALLFTPYWIDLTDPLFWGWNYAQPLLVIIAKINMILLVFNMMPAFPMDGGRVLRAALAMPFGRLRATRYAGFLGQSLGLLFFSAGVFELIFQRAIYIGGVRISDFILAAIGLFVFIAARREIQNVRMKEKLKSITVGEIMSPATVQLHADAPIHEMNMAIPLDQGFVVYRDSGIEGMLFSEYMTHARKTATAESTIGEFTSGRYEEMSPEMTLARALDRFRQNGYRACPVVSDGKVVGMLTRKDLRSAVDAL